MAVSSEMSGGSHRDLSSHSTSEDEDTKSEKVPFSGYLSCWHQLRAF